VNAPRPAYRGRFAPSPTGPLHFGSLIAAVASYCDARAAGGEWHVRIEDIDLPRARPGAERAIMSALERYGFAWDGPVVRQSERTAMYEDALDALRDRDDVYACACTRRELEAAPIGAGGERVYPGTCRDGVPANRSGRAARAWRLRVGASRMAWRDRLQGPQAQDLARDVGDFVVQRADGLFAYQLAVVVDDDAQGITDVVRGADLLAATGWQLEIRRLLGLAPVRHAHLPLVVEADGSKLSKSASAAAVAGLPPAQVLLQTLNLLQQQPPAELAQASTRQILDWATLHWQPARFTGLPKVPIAQQQGLEV